MGNATVPAPCLVNVPALLNTALLPPLTGAPTPLATSTRKCPPTRLLNIGTPGTVPTSDKTNEPDPCTLTVPALFQVASCSTLELTPESAVVPFVLKSPEPVIVPPLHTNAPVTVASPVAV